MIHKHECDVLIIGGGMAGAFAALRAREFGVDVVLIDKAFFGRGGAAALASGAYKYFEQGDSVEAWTSGYGDTVDQRVLSKAVPLTSELINKMQEWGVDFVKRGNEVLRYASPTIGDGTIKCNAGLVGGGPQMMMALRAAALKRGVRVIDKVMVTDLLTSDARRPTSECVIGAFGFNIHTGESYLVNSKTTVLCAGGFNVPYPAPGEPLPSMPIDISGDAIAMAMRVGGKVGGLDVGGAKIHSVEFFTAPALEHLTGQGVRWLNSKGEEFMKHYDRESGSEKIMIRHSLPAAMIKETMEGRGPIYADMRHFTADQLIFLKTVLPIVFGNYERAGYDVSMEPVPYLMIAAGTQGVNGGGLVINEACETNVPNLFAAGSSSNGANMVKSINLSHASVLGWWAGESAARKSKETDLFKPLPQQIEASEKSVSARLSSQSNSDYEPVQLELRRIFKDLGNILTEEKLQTAIELVVNLKSKARNLKARDLHELIHIVGLTNCTLTSELVLRFLLHRTESRGTVLRADYPETDNENWLKWTHATMNADESFKFTDLQIPNEAYLWKKPRKGRFVHSFFRQVGNLGERSTYKVPDYTLQKTPVKPRIEINSPACIGCGVCVESCPTDVIYMNKRTSKPEARYQEDCEGCFLCEIDCPTRAINVRTERWFNPKATH